MEHEQLQISACERCRFETCQLDMLIDCLTSAIKTVQHGDPTVVVLRREVDVL